MMPRNPESCSAAGRSHHGRPASVCGVLLPFVLRPASIWYIDDAWRTPRLPELACFVIESPRVTIRRHVIEGWIFHRQASPGVDGETARHFRAERYEREA